MSHPPPLPPSSPAHPRSGPPPPRPSLAWLWWLIGGIVLLLIVLVVVAVAGMAKLIQDLEDFGLTEYSQPSEAPLLADRAGHRTQWIPSSYEPEGPPPEPPTNLFQLVRYASPAGDLAAYLTPDPGDGKRHPAMVWATGGFGGIGDYLWQPATRHDDQTAAAFREAGIVLMCPSWRGENDNPGRFELFYGEVDDFLSAIEYVKGLPWVNPDRVYIGGHSTGGTLTLLAATTGVDARAAFSFGGAPDLVDVMDDGEGYGNTPYDLESRRDNELRSAIRYTAFIRTPTFYFEGEDNPYYLWAAEAMQDRAEEADVPFRYFELPGDHFDILAPTTRLVAQKILADTGPTCNIRFTGSELETAWNRMHDIDLAEVLDGWLADPDPAALSALFEDLEEDIVPQNEVDLDAYNRTLRTLMKWPASEEQRELMEHLVSYAEDIETPYLELWCRTTLPELESWIDERAAAAGDDEEETDFLFELLGWLADIDSPIATRSVRARMQAGFRPDDWSWATIFYSMYPEESRFGPFMRQVAAAPPDRAIGAALLERVNDACLNDDYEGPHPFDSPAGRGRLAAWIDAGGHEGVNAAIALAYVGDPIRAALLEPALSQSDRTVQLEAAWADCLRGGVRGRKALQEFALDPNRSSTAVTYLEELGHADAVPARAREPAFAATAEMLQWLQHPNELGDPPESIEVFDRREIFWPPMQERIPVWLFEFTYRFDEDEPLRTGYGMTGGMTWSSFETYETEPSFLELYAHHCALETQRDVGDGVIEDRELSHAQAAALLQAKNPGVF